MTQEFDATFLSCNKKYIRKGFFSYGYCDSSEKFRRFTWQKEGLPDKNKFYNSLTNHEIND